VGLKIMQEYEDFSAALSRQALEAYDKIQQEEQLKERNLLDSVINHSIDGIMAFDKDLKIQAFNKALEVCHGIKQDNIIGKNIFTVFPDFEHTEIACAIQTAIKGSPVNLKDRPYKNKEGYYDLNILPLLDTSGELLGGVSLVHDITDRKKNEDALHKNNLELQEQKDELLAAVEALRASNEELEITRNKLEEMNRKLEKRIHYRTEQLEYQRQWLYNLFMQVPGLIGILSGEEGNLVLFNQAFRKLLGGRQVLGMPMRDAWPELQGQGYFEDIDKVLKTSITISRQEFPGLIDRNNDGTLHQAYFNFVYLPYLNPRGETEGVIMYGVDVTEQVEARKKIEESEEKLKLALESAQMGTWDYDPQKGQSHYSLLFSRIFGYKIPPVEWNYDLWMKHIAPEYKDYVNSQYQNALKTGNLLYDTKIVTADGHSRWIAVRGKVLFNEKKSPIRYAGVVLDISERKDAEVALKKSHEELTRINTDLDNFIYTASHDLRSPIVNLESLIALLNKGLSEKLESEHQQLLNMMTTSIARLKRTIDALTDITRIQKEDELQEKLLFEDVLNEVKLDLESQLQESGASLNLDLQVPSIYFVPHNLRSILYNLLSNALKYRDPDKPLQISIATYAEGVYTVLSIKDNGLGISSANQKKLFSMFKRFHSHVKGSGIGLYLIKRIVENVGGKIEAESEEGVGSTFRLYILAS
ncbi:MAG: PAS domain S-box protein, partial [Bacteroidetes bacterium]|nr:PAS domain S-box protein [Bacteroidota bacterium]